MIIIQLIRACLAKCLFMMYWIHLLQIYIINLIKNIPLNAIWEDLFRCIKCRALAWRKCYYALLLNKLFLVKVWRGRCTRELIIKYRRNLSSSNIWNFAKADSTVFWAAFIYFMSERLFFSALSKKNYKCCQSRSEVDKG